jgi:protein-S-isoprenylcysteine O-methyltransferase Ste14
MVRLPPPAWALLYLLIAAGISALTGWQPVPGLPIAPLGIALVVVGVVLSFAAAGFFRRAGTTLNPTATAHGALVTTGPFRFSRNPMYLSLVIVTLGIAVWVGAWPMLLAPIAIFATTNWVHIPFEEANMRREFGAAFDAYAGRVRRWL